MWSQAPDVERARRKRAGEGVTHQGLADRPSISSSPVHGGGILPAIVTGTEPSPSLGPRSTAPGGMGRAHGPAKAAVVRGKQKPRPRNEHSPTPGGQAARTPQLPAQKRGCLTTERPKLAVAIARASVRRPKHASRLGPTTCLLLATSGWVATCGSKPALAAARGSRIQRTALCVAYCVEVIQYPDTYRS